MRQRLLLLMRTAITPLTTYFEVPVTPVMADLAAVYLVKPVTAVVALVMTSTFSSAGSVSIMKKSSVVQVASAKSRSKRLDDCRRTR